MRAVLFWSIFNTTGPVDGRLLLLLGLRIGWRWEIHLWHTQLLFDGLGLALSTSLLAEFRRRGALRLSFLRWAHETKRAAILITPSAHMRARRTVGGWWHDG